MCETKYGRSYNLPVFYFTQLLGLAMGCSESELSLKSLVIDPRPLMESKGLRGASTHAAAQPTGARL